jgi:peptide chain release factor subunit 1
MLSNEYGTASNIKSRVNRLSVLAAITSTQQRLKLYNRVPTNGLVVYCGTILTVRYERMDTTFQAHQCDSPTGRRQGKESQFRL